MLTIIVLYLYGGVFLKRYISIDRIEGEFFVCEDEDCNLFDLKKEDFAEPVKAGDCCFLGEDRRWHLDQAETDARRKKAIDLLKSLIKKD